MNYQFEYFYEPSDAEKPIKKLYINVEFEFIDEPNPASYYGDPRHSSVRSLNINIYDNMGVDVTKDFWFLKPKLKHDFDTKYSSRVIDSVLNNK